MLTATSRGCTSGRPWGSKEVRGGGPKPPTLSPRPPAPLTGRQGLGTRRRDTGVPSPPGGAPVRPRGVPWRSRPRLHGNRGLPRRCGPVSMATEASPPCRAGLPRFGGASPPKPRPLTCGLRAAACCTRSVTARSAGPSPSPAAMPALHIPGRLPPPSATPPLPAPRAQPITAQRRGSWPMAAGGGRPAGAAMLGRSGRHGGWCKGHPKGGQKHPGAPQKHPRTPQRHPKARGHLGGAEGKGRAEWSCSGCLQCAPFPSLLSGLTCVVAQICERCARSEVTAGL